MRSINFEEGLKKFCINGDENRVIRFNPGDPNLLERANESIKRIEGYQKDMEGIRLNPDGTLADDSQDGIQILKGFENLIRKETNYIFNADVYDVAFNGQSPLCTVGKKKEFLFEAFYNVVIPMVEKEVEEFNHASQARVEKYKKGYVK